MKYAISALLTAVLAVTAASLASAQPYYGDDDDDAWGGRPMYGARTVNVDAAIDRCIRENILVRRSRFQMMGRGGQSVAINRAGLRRCIRDIIDSVVLPRSSSMSSRSSSRSSMSTMSSSSMSSSSSGSSLSSTSVGSQMDVDATIHNYAFDPPVLLVKRGTTVTWTNTERTSIPHNVIGGDGGPRSPILYPGQSYSFTFNNVGTFWYYCSIHPNMRGRVVVM